MDQTSRILLIDDDEESRHDLETVLAFIGEQAIPATSNYWQSPAMESVGKSTDIFKYHSLITLKRIVKCR